MQKESGELIERTKGTPQGGVISPVLSNIFMHYVFDVWMNKYYPQYPWCRYADDGLVHCKTEEQAQQLYEALKQRFKECKLEMHPEKTKIVYCKDEKRKGTYPKVEFDFLGYCFRQRVVKNTKQNSLFRSFTPAASKASIKAMRARTRKLGLGRKTDLSLLDIAKICNPILRGWIAYYGKYGRTALETVFRHFNKTLIAWAMRTFKKLRRKRRKATRFMINILKKQPELFTHWKMGMSGLFT
jgi:group II intron reverse transcriptase/maturase